ncbi:1-(5-phosphoribosyl)-5-[(5-phosphoribosylamino) methylideneamino]imidazole-4-carboxamide isomerase [Paradesulfitobacterium aromaticivorans]
MRLLQGRMEQATVYADDPVAVAQDFARQGAEYLHVVDLNGAFAGEPVNDEVIKKIVGAVSLKVQVGGGIRTLERVVELLELGVERVILGTVAVRDPDLVVEAVQRYGERIVVGIDAKDGRVAVQGWAETTDLGVVELALAMKKVGVKRVIFTDIARDGMLQGVNVESTARLAQATGLAVIASGGIAGLEDLTKLRAQADQGVLIEGAIVGKALYAGAFTLEEAFAAVER